ncbi:MAG: 23S rRNA (uracil(1939)-C(5))-methyltransferase RlmD [Succinivibrionaceae bacterium]|nr:23S rRNA (uracil(1939)-C(5))-methyltransferase RlmD [Succinivibrionaceae bacterium]
MVEFYHEKRRPVRQRATRMAVTALDLEGRGVGRVDGRIHFVEGLMPGEEAMVEPLREESAHSLARLQRLLTESPERRRGLCPHEGRCGGCPLLHLPPAMAFAAKVEGVARLLGKSLRGLEFPGAPKEAVAAPSETGYRRACRLSLRNDHGKTLLGMRCLRSHDVERVTSCAVLTPRLGELLPHLYPLVQSLPSRKSVGHVEMLDSDGKVGLLLRLTARPQERDLELLRELGGRHDLVVSTLAPRPSHEQAPMVSELREDVVCGNGADLFLECEGMRIPCRTSSFVQVNRDMNARLIAAVKAALEGEERGSLLDLYCGVGNFSFPLARMGFSVAGADISAAMIHDAQEAARAQGLADRLSFHEADLSREFAPEPFARRGGEVAVLDPGREGAMQAVAFLARRKVRTIAMVSCNPRAAARDARTLLDAGYALREWSAFDMFPRTAHLELLLVFAK